MKNKKISIFIASLFVLISFITGGILSFNTEKKYYNNLPIYTASPMYLYDTSTPQKAIGISDYVFVAKIKSVVGTKYLDKSSESNKKALFEEDSSPYTLYEIEVIKNIKGQLNTEEPILFIQFGGLNKDGKGYTLIEGVNLLTENNYYLILSNTIKMDGKIILEASEATRLIDLGQTINYEVINKYEEAYKNEEVPKTYQRSEKSTFDITNEIR